jgi:hypothetical protein
MNKKCQYIYSIIQCGSLVGHVVKEGMPEHRNAGTPECRNTGMPEHLNAGIPEHRNIIFTLKENF